MKRVIRLLPILFALPLLGLIPNSQRIEKAEAVTVTAGKKYFVGNKDKTYGIEKKIGDYETPVMAKYNELSRPLLFEEATGGYKIKDFMTGQYLCHSEGVVDLYFFSNTATYLDVWTLVESGSDFGLKTSDNCYLCISGSKWKAVYKASIDSSCYLDFYCVDDGASSFVSAMNDIKCNYSTSAPNPSEWDAAGDQYDLLIDQVKAYLKVAVADMTYGDINTPERAVGKYDYIVNKYNKGGVVYTEFITGRSTSGLVNIDNSTLHSNSVTNTPIIIVISFITVLSFTSILILKKKR